MDRFKLLKNVGNLKRCKIFDSFGGLVSGVVVKIESEEVKIKFSNKEYFKLVK